MATYIQKLERENAELRKENRRLNRFRRKVVETILEISARNKEFFEEMRNPPYRANLIDTYKQTLKEIEDAKQNSNE